MTTASNDGSSLRLQHVAPRGRTVRAAQVDTLDYDGMCAILRWCGGRSVGPETDGTPEDVIGIIEFSGAHLRNGDWVVERSFDEGFRYLHYTDERFRSLYRLAEEEIAPRGTA